MENEDTVYSETPAEPRKKRKDAGKKREHYVVKDRAWLMYKNRCNGAGIKMPVDKETFLKYAAMGCRFCAYEGDRMTMTRYRGDLSFSDGNIVPVCWDCDNMRKLFPQEKDFLDHMRKIYINVFGIK